jgi:hypothetical protein
MVGWIIFPLCRTDGLSWNNFASGKFVHAVFPIRSYHTSDITTLSDNNVSIFHKHIDCPPILIDADKFAFSIVDDVGSNFIANPVLSQGMACLPSWARSGTSKVSV